MATAERIYVDPSALLKLYVHEPESAAMSAWRGRTRGGLSLSEPSRLEIINGICLAGFRKAIGSAAVRDALDSFDEDITDGRYVPVDVLWRATLRRAAEISRAHTQALGCRTLDVLHVATAIELGLPVLITFDRRQQSLARTMGLRVLAPKR